MRRLLVPLLVLVALLAGITLGGHPETLPGFLRDTLVGDKDTRVISEAIETCCRSIPHNCINPKVIASVIGIDTAMSSADRHSQKPMSETMTTRMIASSRLPRNSSMCSLTCVG